MQKVRIIKRDNSEELLDSTQVSVNFDKQVVSVWRWRYWEEIPFDKVLIVSTWDEENQEY